MSRPSAVPRPRITGRGAGGTGG